MIPAMMFGKISAMAVDVVAGFKGGVKKNLPETGRNREHSLKDIVF